MCINVHKSSKYVTVQNCDIFYCTSSSVALKQADAEHAIYSTVCDVVMQCGRKRGQQYISY